MTSIKSKIFVTVLSGIIVSSLIIGTLGIFWSNRAVLKDSNEILDLMAQVQTSGLNSMFSDVERSTIVLSHYVEDELDSTNLFYDEEAFSRYIAKLENIAFYTANSTAHTNAVYVRFAPELTTKVESFAWKKNGKFFEQEDLSEFPVFDSDFSNSWYYKAKDSGRGVWTLPYYNDGFKEYVVSFAIPVYKNGQFFAVVGMDIDFDDIAWVVNSISVYDTGYAFLTDEDFVVLYHRSIPAGTRIVDQTADFKRIEVAENSEQFYQYTFKNIKSRMIFKNLHNGMRLVVSVPKSEIDRGRTDLILMLVVSILVILFLGSVWCIWLSRRFTRPLKELTDSTSHIVAGDYDFDFKNRPDDEIGELMGTFTLMAKSLKVQFEYINSLAYIDSMTGAKNKRSFIDERTQINSQIQKAAESGEDFSFGVIVFDVNNLKYVNDNFGHKDGDSLIKNACALIKKHFSESPVFRIGGDEFVVVITGKDFENRVELFTNFKTEIDWLRANKTEPAEKVSIAAGMAVFDSSKDSEFQSVVERADEEMYKTKTSMKGGREFVR